MEEVKNVESHEQQPKKKKKLWLKIVLSILIILIIAIVGILVFIDNILTTGIRTGGSMIMKTKVEVDAVRLKILRGTLDIENLRVANPPDYKDGYAIELPNFHVALQINSLLTDTIIVDDIEIVGIKVNYEPTLTGGSNLQTLLNNINDPHKKPPPEVTKDKETEADAKEMAAKSVVIKKLSVREGHIGITMLKLTTPIPLPAIEMTGIGEKSKVSMAEAVGIFFKELFGSVVKVSGQAVSGLGSVVKDAGSGISSGAQSIGSGISSGAQSIGSGVKGIFSSGDSSKKEETPVKQETSQIK